MKKGTSGIVTAAGIGLSLLVGAESRAGEGVYEYAAVTSDQHSAIYRLNTATGELTYCYWVKVEGKEIGKTMCDPAGENAGPQKPGVYGLVPSNFKGGTDVFRVDRLNGKVWQCFPLNVKVVCAPPAP